MSIVKKAMKEARDLKKSLIIDGITRERYNRYRFLEVLVDDYKSTSFMGSEDFFKIYVGYFKSYNFPIKKGRKTLIKKIYDKDYFDEETPEWFYEK